MSNITKCDKRQSGLFLFLKKGRDTHVADVLYKKETKRTEEKSMNEKLIINTNLLRKEAEFKTKSCAVEKAIAVSHAEFDNLKRHPLQDNDLIAENTDLMYCDRDDIYHCLLIYDEEQGDGLLIEAEGSSYARYVQYIPNAKLLYENHIQTHLQEMKFYCPLEISRVPECWSDEEYEKISSYEASAYKSEINHFISDFNLPEEKEQRVKSINSVKQKKVIMKKSNLNLAATVMICGAFLFSSCIGSFGLHSKLVNWNQSIGTKFVNELVYLACNIIPVYPVCYLADALVINSIEFWSGSNPMANVGDVKKVKGENGNYLVKTLENGYSITKEGETTAMELVYDKELNTWNVVAEGVSTELLQMNGDGTAQMYLPNGEAMNVTLDAQGVAAARQATMINTYYAAR